MVGDKTTGGKRTSARRSDHTGPRRPCGHPPLWLGTLLFVAVGAAVVWTHWPALSARGISFDDSVYIDGSYLVRNPSWASAKRLMTEVLEPSTIRGYYHPLAMISLMLDVARGGRLDHPQAFHQTNLLLHVMNTGLVIVLVYLCFGQPWPAAMAGLLFGLHPLTVEPVVWIAARKALLAASFSLWSLVLYVGYARYGRRGLYGASAITYAMALLSKPTSIPLPVLMLVLDYWPLGRFDRKRLVEKTPFFALGAISAVIACVSHARTAILSLPQGTSIVQGTLLASYKAAFFLGKMLWPTRLSCLYEAPEPVGLSNPVIAASVIGVLLVTVGLVISARKLPAVAAGGLFFLVAVAPMLGLFTYGESWVFAFDNYLYLPIVGPLLVLSFFLARFWSGPPGGAFVASRRWAALIGVGVLCGSESAATRHYLAFWGQSEAYAQHMLTLAPNAALLHNHLALLLDSQGRADEAIRHCREAVRIKPDYAEAHNNLALALSEQGNPEEAAAHYTEALRLRPGYPEAHNNYGLLLLGRGRIDDALAHCQAALELKPEYADAHNNLGLALAARGEVDQAIAQYRRALELRPDHMKAINNLAISLIDKGQVAEATAAFRRAVQLDPASAEAHNNLGLALRGQNRAAEAIEEFREALRLKPGYADAQVSLSELLAETGPTQR